MHVITKEMVRHAPWAPTRPLKWRCGVSRRQSGRTYALQADKTLQPSVRPHTAPIAAQPDTERSYSYHNSLYHAGHGTSFAIFLLPIPEVLRGGEETADAARCSCEAECYIWGLNPRGLGCSLGVEGHKEVEAMQSGLRDNSTAGCRALASASSRSATDATIRGTLH
ncbi:hypothetical protein BAUCODRAFT_266720 [Baudoinia panamericana UAMH 10762]|uniref:Uncharacterized protein n=1 Tax=Baudoinia panamericana (strain UAMH 10762) TaxID=717646 RepID=M2M946_BAUPA|nr:uncharacterized protein BAUCODRAFT_266720 [Baudoinia panamericana UAMH 10762]EMC92916.1 hypothetical protein BAUCODRAFT_266720 [Baudoinia panamericana UAMH 10762]